MNFNQRLLRYLIGVMIGLLIVYALFGDRNWTGWTPGNRVLKELREGSLHKSERAQCQMDCLGISDAAVKTMLTTGKVSFSESNARSTPRVYVVKNDLLQMTFELSDSSAHLISARLLDNPNGCPCSE